MLRSRRKLSTSDVGDYFSTHHRAKVTLSHSRITTKTAEPLKNKKRKERKKECFDRRNGTLMVVTKRLANCNLPKQNNNFWSGSPEIWLMRRDREIKSPFTLQSVLKAL